jgi:3-methyladenine DNA glycosylase Mpg
MYLLDGPVLAEEQVVIATRVGLREEHQQDWRFYIKGDPFVSRP